MEASVKPLDQDTVIQEVFNVIIELRINADKLEQVLQTLREENNDY